MSKRPFLSIITCTYNSERFLPANLESVLMQHQQDIEHIFIDGMSTDATQRLIKQYQRKAKYPVTTFSLLPKGIASAMNEGIKKSRGQYVLFLHSDDQFLTDDVLSRALSVIRRSPDIDWWYGQAIFQDLLTQRSRLIPHRSIYFHARFWLLLLTNYIPHQAVFMKKSIFAQYGDFNTTFSGAMDWEYWIRVTQSKVPNGFLPFPIVRFSVHPQSQTERNQSGKSQWGKALLPVEREYQKILNSYIPFPLLRRVLFFIRQVDLKRSFFV